MHTEGSRTEFDLEIVDGILPVADGLGFEENGQGLLVPDETRLSREQVIERVFTCADVVRGRRVSESIRKAGRNELIGYLGPTSSFVGSQIRQVYDMNHIRGIGRNILENPLGQLQMGLVGLHTEASAEVYLEDLNEHFGSEFTLDDLRWHGRLGGYLITIAGHNRQFGIAAMNREANGDPDRGKGFMVRVFRDIKFWEALEAQAGENTGQNPHMWERALEIRTIKEQSARHGVPKSNEDIASVFGTDPDQVARALRFEALPESVKQMVIEERLPYSGAFELDRLLKLYEVEDVVRIAEQFAVKKLSGSKIVEEIRLREVVKDLPDEIRLMVDSGMIKYKLAEVLDEMQRCGVSGQEITDVAVIFSLQNPTLQKAREIAEGYITAAKQGQGNMFVENELQGLSAEERDKAIADSKRRSVQATMAARTTDVTNGVAALAGYLSNGLAGSAVEGTPIGRGVQDAVIEAIERLANTISAEGGEDSQSQSARLQASIAALRPSPDSNVQALF